MLQADPTAVVAHVRGLMLALFAPLGVMLAGFAAGATAAHQLQVRGLWAPALLAPDPARLWSRGPRTGAERGAREDRLGVHQGRRAGGGLALADSRPVEQNSSGSPSSSFRPWPPRSVTRCFSLPERLALVMLILGLADFASSLFPVRGNAPDDA